jgi:hypothetical protein
MTERCSSLVHVASGATTTTTTTTAPSCCIPASYYHMSATLQTMSITVVNLQDNRAVFQIFITLLRFSFDSPSYFYLQVRLRAQNNFSCTTAHNRIYNKKVG